jgi:hypothetical protein
VLVADEIVSVSDEATIVELDGPEDASPSPNAVTTTSAMRLKVNFVIIFLSLVVTKTFFVTAGKEILAL